MPQPIRIEIFEAASAVLIRNGIDPSKPGFARPEVQEVATVLLMEKGGWTRETAAAVVAGLVD